MDYSSKKMKANGKEAMKKSIGKEVVKRWQI